MEYNIDMSFFSFLKSNKEGYSLVFDIGSGSVTGGLIKFTERGGVDVVYYAKMPIPFQHEISIPKHLQHMKTTLAGLAEKIRVDGLKKIGRKIDTENAIDSIFYVFSSPWSISQTKVIRIKEIGGFDLSEDFFNKIISDQENTFEIDIAKSGKIIERKINQIKVDGQIIENLCNGVAKDVEISLFFTSVPEKILNIVDEAVSKSFTVKNIWCHSLSLVILSMIKNLFPQNNNFVSINITEEITDISIVSDGSVTNEGSIPFGRNHFIREISNVLRVPMEIADSMLKMHGFKNNNELASLKLAVIMDRVSNNWLAEISKVLSKIIGEHYTSESIFFVTRNELTHFLKDKLQKQDLIVSHLDNYITNPARMNEDTIFKLELKFLDNLYKI